MGDSQDNYALGGSIQEDDEDPQVDLAEEGLDDENLRYPSPMPELPVTGVMFLQLSISEQFQYTTPVLVALLNGQYLPARKLHIGFMKGGKSRNAVASAAWKRGDVSHKDKADLSTCIRWWMRRRQILYDLVT